MYFEKFTLLFLTIYCYFLTELIRSQTLEVVDDTELLSLCRAESQVVVLFSMYCVNCLYLPINKMSNRFDIMLQLKKIVRNVKSMKKL